MAVRPPGGDELPLGRHRSGRGAGPCGCGDHAHGHARRSPGRSAARSRSSAGPELRGTLRAGVDSLAGPARAVGRRSRRERRAGPWRRARFRSGADGGAAGILRAAVTPTASPSRTGLAANALAPGWPAARVDASLAMGSTVARLAVARVGPWPATPVSSLATIRMRAEEARCRLDRGMQAERGGGWAAPRARRPGRPGRYGTASRRPVGDRRADDLWIACRPQLGCLHLAGRCGGGAILILAGLVLLGLGS